MTTEQRQDMQTRIDKAVARAWEMTVRGIRPLLVNRDDAPDGGDTYQVWTVPSRTNDGTLYRVELYANAGGEMRTSCSCAAGQADRPCWHRALARLAALGQAPHDEASVKRLAQSVTAADLSGKPAA